MGAAPQPGTNILIILAILVWICIRRSRDLASVTSSKLSRRQKLIGVVALLCVVMIAINPEFWALGLLGDTTFFDVFVLLMSIQFQMTVVWVCGGGGKLLTRGLRWMITPSPRWSHLMAAWTVGTVVEMTVVAYTAVRRVTAKSGIGPLTGDPLA